AGVHDEVHDDLLDLTGIRQHGDALGGGLDDDLDVGSDETLEERLQLLEEAVQVEGRRLEDLAPREGEELTRQRRRALGGALDRLGGARPSATALEAGEKDLRVAAEGGREVVEVVRDPAGEETDGLHLLRLAELGLEAALLGDVAHDAVEADDASRLVAHRPRLVVDPAPAAVRVPD